MSLLLIKLLISFISGGLFIIAITWLSERVNPKVGGLITGLPTKLLISLLLLAWIETPTISATAATIVPVSIGANSLFLVFLIYFFKFGKLKAYIISTILWCLCTIPILFIKGNVLPITLFLSIIYFLLSFLYFRHIPYRPISQNTLPKQTHLYRFTSGGIVVALTILISNFFGPLWGGLITTFPIIFSTSIFLLEQSHGIKFASSVAKTMPYGGIVNVVFSVIYSLLVVKIGVTYALLIAILVGSLLSFLLYTTFLKERQHKAIEN